MELYDETLIYTITTITKMYAINLGLVLIAFVVCLLLKKRINIKRPIQILIGIFLCGLVSYLLLIVPRVVDLKNSEYIRVENSTLIVDQFNNNPKGSNVMFFGYAHIMPKNGRSIRVNGIDFFDLSNIKNIDTAIYNYDIIYAKHSHQLIAMEKNTDFIEDITVSDN